MLGGLILNKGPQNALLRASMMNGVQHLHNAFSPLQLCCGFLYGLETSSAPVWIALSGVV